MSLKETIQADMKAALRAQESARLSALRLLLAAIQRREIDEGALDDIAVESIVRQQIKQRRDSATQFEAGGRPELAATERFEIEVLSVYLPEAISEAEIDAALEAAFLETGATTLGDMGKVMALLKPRLAKRADMAALSRRVRERLG